ncbi:MAG TPA: CHASE2 domain-containing protein [Waterburya sp.]
MAKLVVLKLGDGSFEEGFSVIVQIGEEERHHSVETIGKLPPIPEIPQYYSTWATSYRRLGLRSRLEASVAQVTNVSKIESCYNAAQSLREHLNSWLSSEPFRPIREKLLEQLNPTDEIRLIIQTENIWLRRLPWHLWDFCDRYPKAEIALSSLNFVRPDQITFPHNKIRILAILGNSTGINIQADRFLLEQLPNAEIRFLVEPQRQELNEELWNQGWDILFFAGHSSSHANGETGRIYLNKTDSLTIEQLKFAVKKAVERGLKIAIFNSCDGLGLARSLADLQIPQTVVMREPVPDRVSQEFLKYFLTAFARGESFYLAVREARERLQGWEDQFPCATWLPMIFQNPAVVPPTWQDLCGKITPLPNPPKSRFRRSRLRAVLLLSVGITSLFLGIRRVGFLQPLELHAFDKLMQVKPAEPPDLRLLVVTVTEEDIQAQKNEPRRGSLSDRSLTRLLAKLESYQPRVIGLDIYRDFPVDSKYPDLAQYLEESDHFIAVCKVSTELNRAGVAPPPEVPAANLGFSDVLVDSGDVVRRHILAMTPGAASPCTPDYALSAQLAFRYLEAHNIQPEYTSQGLLKLGKVVFQRLKPHSSGYQAIDAWGYQVLLNYRFYHSPQDFVRQVTLTQVLNGQFDPNAVKDRIVIIGVTAPSANDYVATPYAQKIPGVVLQAQQVSQILSAVLDGRPLLWIWPSWTEALWIWGWSLVGGLLSWRFRMWQRWVLVLVALGLLYWLSFELFTRGGWVPLVPAALVLVSTSAGVFAYTRIQAQRQPSTLAL